MRKLVLLLSTALLLSVAPGMVSADRGGGRFQAKAGDGIEVCGCGAGCGCGSISRREANCPCGRKMVKATVAKVEKGRVFYKVNGKELSAPQQGKYACACGAGCDCGTVSQKQGNCACGKKMALVK